MSMHVTAKFSKTVDADLKNALQKPMALATAAANHIRQRMLLGDTATPADPYSSNPTAGAKDNKRYYISPAYAKEAGAGKQTRWESSAVMHSTLGGKPGNVTGGMWSGLQVRNYGAEGAVIDFGGSTLGSSSTLTAKTQKVEGSYEVTLSEDGKLRARQLKDLKRDEGGKVLYRRKPKLVRNAHKASTLFRHSHIAAVQNTDDELQALANALAAVAAQQVAMSFGGKATNLPHAGNPRLYAATFRELKK
jgi:hypothetical protein